jgi:hypothetical protein
VIIGSSRPQFVRHAQVAPLVLAPRALKMLTTVRYVRIFDRSLFCVPGHASMFYKKKDKICRRITKKLCA